jgi:hypothetical protein
MKNGRVKLAYGASPEDALKILGFRLSEEEMEQINREDFELIPQKDLQKYKDKLG